MEDKKTSIFLRLEDRQAQKVEEWAVKLGINRSEVLRRLIDEVSLKPVLKFKVEEPAENLVGASVIVVERAMPALEFERETS